MSSISSWDSQYRGYTGHEQLVEQQLVHMNGRIYDYNLGRFMSVDPFIQMPESSQSINPYSYIMNNPMAGVDPSGYQSQDVDTSAQYTQTDIQKTEEIADKTFDKLEVDGNGNVYITAEGVEYKVNGISKAGVGSGAVNVQNDAGKTIASSGTASIGKQNSGTNVDKDPSFKLQNPKSIDDFSLSDEVGEIAESASTVAGYFSGLGSEHKDYDENSIQSFRLSQTPEFERIRSLFFKLYGKELSEKSDWSGINATGFGKGISKMEGLKIAWDSPTGFYVGTFHASISGGKNRSLTYTLSNDSSLASLTDRSFGEISYSRVKGQWRPLSTVSQTYTVKENYKYE